MHGHWFCTGAGFKVFCPGKAGSADKMAE
jgi:hypothetical protein